MSIDLILFSVIVPGSMFAHRKLKYLPNIGYPDLFVQQRHLLFDMHFHFHHKIKFR